MVHLNSIQSRVEHEEQIENLPSPIGRGPDSPDSLNLDARQIHEDERRLLCGDCGGPCKTHTWDKRQQVFIGECCRQPETSALPANYAEQQVTILEDVVGFVESPAELLDQALAHLRFARMQSTDPLMMHVEIAERLLRRLKEAA